MGTHATALGCMVWPVLPSQNTLCDVITAAILCATTRVGPWEAWWLWHWCWMKLSVMEPKVWLSKLKSQRWSDRCNCSSSLPHCHQPIHDLNLLCLPSSVMNMPTFKIPLLILPFYHSKLMFYYFLLKYCLEMVLHHFWYLLNKHVRIWFPL